MPETIIQKIENIINNVNKIIKDSVDPNNEKALLNAKFDMIDVCIKTLAREVNEISNIVYENEKDIGNIKLRLGRLIKIVIGEEQL